LNYPILNFESILNFQFQNNCFEIHFRSFIQNEKFEIKNFQPRFFKISNFSIKRGEL